MSTNIDIIISAVSKGVNQAVKQTSKDITSCFKKSRLAVKAFNASVGNGHRAVAGLGAHIKGLIGAYAGFEGIRKTTEIIKDSDQAIFNLSASVKAASREFNNTGDMESWGSSIARLSDELIIYSDTSLRNAVSRTVDMTKRLGLSEKQMIEVIKRSADLGAGKVELEGAIERVTAALRGEAESAEYLGLTLNENYIKAWYEAAGATQGAWKDLSDIQKAQIRYAVLLEQSSEMQGRAARSAETFGGALALVRKEIENSIINNKDVTAAMSDLADTLRKNSGEIGKAVSGLLTIFTKAFNIIIKYKNALLTLAGAGIIVSGITKITLAVKGLNAAFMVMSGSGILSWLVGLRAALSSAAVSATTLTASLAAVSAAMAIPAIIQAANALWDWKKAADMARESQDRLNIALETGIEKFKPYAHIIMPADITKSTQAELKELNALLLKSRAYWQHMAMSASDPAMEADATATLNRVKKKLAEVQALQKGEISPKSSVPVPDNKPPSASDDALAKSHLARLDAATRTSLAMLTDTYKQGEIALEEYFSRRKALIETQFNEEIAALQKLADAQTDPSKKLALEDQIFSKQQAHKRDLISLSSDQLRAEDALAQKKLQINEMLSDLDARSGEDKGGGLLQAGFDAETAEMDARHTAELEKFQELLDNKLAAEMGYANEAEALRGIQSQQRLEKDKLLEDQDRRIGEARLQNAKTVAGGLSGIFSNLYELTGKKSKEFFYLAKAAALAEAIVNTAQGVTKALAQGGIFGPIMAGVIATAGAVQIATIAAQKLASGGIVHGHSPSSTADNIPIMATAGEFMQPVPTVRFYGHSVMEAIKKRLIPREVFQGFALPGLPSLSPSFAYAAGGMVNAPASTSGSQPGAEINIVNIIDPEEIEDYLNSPGGENAILNVISSKKRTIERILL